MASSPLNVNNLFGVQGIVAVITGGGSGLGLYVAKALDANGAKAVYIIGRRSAPLEKAASEALNKSIIPLQGDVTSKDSLASMAEKVASEQGYINVLFANSGIIGVPAGRLLNARSGVGPKVSVQEFKRAMWEPSMEDFTQAFHVNVTGVFYTSVAFLELLDAGNKAGNITQKSNIIVTSSIAGFARALSAGFAYGASKAGTTHLVKMLATYFGDWKIRVNAVAPGMFVSEMTDTLAVFKQMRAEGKDPGVEGGFPRALCPAERCGTEEDMAGVALFMMSRAGGYLNGNVIVPDGGRLGEMPATQS